MDRQCHGSRGNRRDRSTDSSTGRSHNKKYSKPKKRQGPNRKEEWKEVDELDASIEEQPTTIIVNASTSAKDDVSNTEQQNVVDKNKTNTDTQEIQKDFIEEPASSPPLKYNYKENQWSPLNPEGKRQYDRKFLMHLQSKPMCLKKPEGLPKLEVIKDSAQVITPEINGSQPLEIKSLVEIPDFTPGYVVSAGPGSSSIRGYSNRNGRIMQANRNADVPNMQKRFTLSINQEVQLQKAENAWRPTHRWGKDAESEQAATNDLYKKVRSILNKLTPQKFQTLVKQVSSLLIDTEEKMKGVIELIFEKAIDEPNFSVAYANLCKCLMAVKVSGNGTTTSTASFQKVLLNKCQKEFEKDINEEVTKMANQLNHEKAENDDKGRDIQAELAEFERKVKQKCLGNIRFIGELYKLHMLTSNIMHVCLKRLLTQGDEDSLECLCRLLITIGKDIDNDKQHKTQDDLMDSYFRDMEDKVKDKKTSARVRFMLQDVIDLRTSNWVPRRAENNPKTIAQIHKEAEREALENSLAVGRSQNHRRSEDRDRRKGPCGDIMNEGWSTVSNKNTTRIDPSKMKLKPPLSDINIKLSPVRNFAAIWGKGSSGAAKRIAPEQELASVPNRFSVLAPEFIPADMKINPNNIASKMANSEVNHSLEPSQLPIAKFVQEAAVVQSKQETITIVPKEEVPKKEDALTLHGPSLMSEDDIKRKVGPMLDEFLHNGDYPDTLICIAEICSDTTVSLFIEESLNHVLERSSQARNMVAVLISSLITKQIIRVEQYIDGLQGILSLAEDYVIDIPRLWEYLAELTAPLLQDGVLPLNSLQTIAAPCISNGLAGDLVSEILHVLSNNIGSHKVGEMWRSSGLEWSDFIQESQNKLEFIKNKKLEFTITCPAPPDASLTTEQIQCQLQLLIRENVTNAEILDWISKNVAKEDDIFIRTLTSAVCESAIYKEDSDYAFKEHILKSRAQLLCEILGQKEQRELHALFAVQALVHRLQSPPGLARQLLETLFDQRNISKEAIQMWRSSDNPEDGKDVILGQLESFFWNISTT